MDKEQAWLLFQYRVGREMHAGWMRQKIANGTPDHLYQEDRESHWQDREGRYVCECGEIFAKHHNDMRPWHELSPEQRAINYEGGRIPFEVGFQVGYNAGFDDGVYEGMKEEHDG